MYRVIGTQQLNAWRSLGDATFATPKPAGRTRAEAVKFARAFARDLGDVVEAAILEHSSGICYRVYPDGSFARVR